MPQDYAVMGKGRRGRSIPYGVRTRKALRNYKKARQLHTLAGLENLWLGNRGKGLREAVSPRCCAVGVVPLASPSFTRTSSVTASLTLGSLTGARKATS